MLIVLQLVLYCLLFTAMVRYAVKGGAIDGLYFYPKPVQERAIEIGLTDRETMRHKRKVFMTEFYIVMLAALVLKKRGILTLIWIAGAAIAAGIIVLIF